jgi:hypothetical protein
MEECVSDMTTSDNAGDTCEWYDARPGQYCDGTYDDEDFSAAGQCCSCAATSFMEISDEKL